MQKTVEQLLVLCRKHGFLTVSVVNLGRAVHETMEQPNFLQKQHIFLKRF